MHIWYVDKTGGGSGYSGSSTGSPIASGTGAATIVGATVDLSVDSPQLSGVVVGDTIRLDARTDGIDTTDIFEITAVDNTLKTVDVTPSPNSITSGVTWVIGGAFNTLARAGRVALAGDRIYAKASASYLETIAAPNIHVGTSVLPIIWEGYTTTIGDGGRVTINGEGTRTTAMTQPGGVSYITMRNFRSTNHTNKGWACGVAVYPIFENCEADNNAGGGFDFDESCVCVLCYSHNNTGNGFLSNAWSSYVGCVANNNTINGFSTLDSTSVIGCVSVGNASYGIKCDMSNGRIATVVNCTVDGSGLATAVGIGFIGGTVIAAVCINNIVYDCVTGITSGTDRKNRFTSRNNVLYNNTSNYGANWTTQFGEILTNPLFVNEAIGDYNLGAGSPAIDAGLGASITP